MFEQLLHVLLIIHSLNVLIYLKTFLNSVGTPHSESNSVRR